MARISRAAYTNIDGPTRGDLVLHDMGAISMFAPVTQGMGRLTESVAKCRQLANVMKDRQGRLLEKHGASGQRENQAISRSIRSIRRVLLCRKYSLR